MKLYITTSEIDLENDEVRTFREYTSSAGDASKVRTRLKKLKHLEIKTEEIELGTTRTELIKHLNGLLADPTWVTEPTATTLGG